MRICLISSLNFNSSYDVNFKTEALSPPLGLLSIASELLRVGHQVSLVDFNYALARGEISLDSNFYNNAVDVIDSLSPQLVGFSTMCNSFHISLRLAQTIKKRLPEVITLFGGPQASIVHFETLNVFPFVDMILRGETEETFPQLLLALSKTQKLNQIPGLTYRINGQVVANPDAPFVEELDSLPMPAYHLVTNGVGDTLTIDVGRGCPFSCTFCSTSKFWKRRFRLKSVNRIIQEMLILKQKYSVSSFSFLHDMFTYNKSTIKNFCDRLQAENLDVTWSCSARLDCVDSELLNLMADSGCRDIYYGLESGSPRMQREIKKNLCLDRSTSVIESTLKAKIKPTLSFIAGFPTEREEDLIQTMDVIQKFLEKPEINIQLHLLAPLAGTSDYELYMHQMKYDGYFSDVAGSFAGFNEPDWFLRYPSLFSSFYYYENENIPRKLFQGLDLFVNIMCSAMRTTVLNLLKNGTSLWSLYSAWHEWINFEDRNIHILTGENMDQFLLEFYNFMNDWVGKNFVDFDFGKTRDEILAFYLRYYGQTRVRIVPQETNLQLA